MAQGPRATTLLERDRELSALESALAVAREGQGSLAVVEAAQGLGKSALLDATARMAERAGMAVLRARGRELERLYPFGAVLQLFSPALAAAAPAQRERLFAGASALSRPLLEPGPEGVVPPQPEEGQVFGLLHGLHWLCANLAEPAGAVLLVDDAAQLDEPSLRFLAYMVERVEEVPVLVVLARHPPARSAPPTTLEELSDRSGTCTLRLAPLGPDCVAHLVRQAFPNAGDALTEAASRATGGNPFLVTELIAAIRAAPGPVDPADLARLGPETVARSVLGRLSRSTFGSVSLARAVAVLGDGTPLRRAATLARIEDRLAPQVADALEEAGILSVGKTLSFVHPLVRSAVLNELPSAERAFMHAQAAAVLRDDGEPAELIATQLADAQPSGAAWATECLRDAAAVAVEHGALATAVRLLRRALEEPPPPALRGPVLVELGRAEAVTGDGRAIVHLEQGLALTGAPGDRAQVELSVGRLLAAQGDHCGAVEAFGRGLDVLASADTQAAGAPGHLAAELRVAMLDAGRFVLGEHARVRDRFAPELASAARGRSTADRMLRAQAAVELALEGGSAEEVAALARQAAEASDAVDGAPLTHSSVLAAAQALAWAGALDEAQALLDAEIGAAESAGLVHDYATGCHHRALVHALAGRVSDAMVDAQVALDGRRFGWRLALSRTCAVLALMLVERGELPGAHEALALAGPRSRWDEESAGTDLLAARARIAMAEGRAGAALEDWLECGSRQEEFGSPNPAVLAWRSGAAAAAGRAGAHGRAAELVEEELALARAIGAARPIGAALRVQGRLTGGPAGVAQLEESVATLEESGAELELAYSEVALGALLRRANRRAAAREPLRIGLDRARRCGAGALARHARDELVGAGGRPRREALSGIEALTPSERRTAELAASGLTNREIAETLFVTIKTVEWHLRNAYGKLEIGSRADLTDALAAAPAA